MYHLNPDGESKSQIMNLLPFVKEAPPTHAPLTVPDEPRIVRLGLVGHSRAWSGLVGFGRAWSGIWSLTYVLGLLCFDESMACHEAKIHSRTQFCHECVQ